MDAPAEPGSSRQASQPSVINLIDSDSDDEEQAATPIKKKSRRQKSSRPGSEKGKSSAVGTLISAHMKV